MMDEWAWSTGRKTGKWKPKYSEKKLFECHFVHHKSHMDWPGIESWHPCWGVGNWLRKPLHDLSYSCGVVCQYNSACLKPVVFIIDMYLYNMVDCNIW